MSPSSKPLEDSKFTVLLAPSTQGPNRIRNLKGGTVTLDSLYLLLEESSIPDNYPVKATPPGDTATTVLGTRADSREEVERV
jgi:hypothetical protein